MLSTLPGDGSDLATAESHAGEILGKYRLVKCIGSGGMGGVYLAEDPLMNRNVAIKILLKEVAKNPAVVRRFLTEAQVTGRLNHPNIIAIYDVLQDKGNVAIVMELLKPGSVMQQIRQRGPLHWIEATRIVSDCCSALVATHEAGLIHRDIKPGNILCSPAGITKLVDFGMVKELPQLNAEAENSQTANLTGTATYMSPEQIAGKPIDKRSDIYSLGVTYFEMLAGRPPFLDRAPQIYFQHHFEPPPDPRTFVADIPEPCVRILLRALAKAPADRYQSAAELRGELEVLLRDPIASEQGFQFLGPSRASMQSARVIASAIEPEKEATRPPASPSGRQPSTSPPVSTARSMRWLGLAALVLGLLGGAALILDKGKHRLNRGAAEPPVAEPTQTPTVPAAASAKLTVGVLQSLSGSDGDAERGLADATQLAIKEQNASGGLLGHPVEAVVVDGRSDESAFIVGAERLVKQLHVAAVFGGGTSASRRAIRQIFESQDSLLIYPGRYEGLESSPNIIYTGGLPNQRVLPVLSFCAQRPSWQRFFILGDDSPYSQAIVALLKEELAHSGTRKIVGEYYLPAGSRDLRAIRGKLKAAKADVIVNSLAGGMLEALHAALRAARITPQQTAVIALNLDEGDVRQLGGDESIQSYLAWDYLEELPGKTNASFLASFKKEYGSNRVVTAEMEAAYLGVKLWALAVQAAGTGDAGAVRAALKNRTYVAPEGEVRIDPDNNHLWKPFNMAKLTSENQVEVVYSAPAVIKPAPLSTAK